MLIRSEFRPAWWLPGAHSQTFWANLLQSHVQSIEKMPKASDPGSNGLACVFS